MTRGAMSCNWIFMMALATGIPGSRRRCFANCSVLLPRAPSLIDTFEAASLMPNYRLRTKRHWADSLPTHEETKAASCAGYQPAPPLDFAAIRARLAGAQGPRFWQSLEELAETEAFQDFLFREFPRQASEWEDDEPGRRKFLKLMGASLALAGLSACTRQPTE